MRIQDPPYFAGLTPIERQQIVLQAVAEQQQEIDGLVSGLFSGVSQATQEATQPLSFATSIAQQNQRAIGPLEFWGNFERQRRANTEIDRQNPLAPTLAGGGANQDSIFRPRVQSGQSPLDFARGSSGGRIGLGPVETAAPRIGLPTPAPIRTINFAEIFNPSGATQNLIGGLIDTLA